MNAEGRGDHPIARLRRAAALHMPEHGDAGLRTGEARDLLADVMADAAIGLGGTGAARKGGAKRDVAKARARSPAVLQASRPKQSKNRILAGRLGPDDLSRLAGAGFAVKARSGERLGVAVTELQVPAGMGVHRALRLAARVSPEAVMVPNGYYYPAGHIEDCEACDVEELIGWSPVTS